ncbi:MAG: hypothetical protein OEU95_03375 [Nitrospirota bacterium]|nr:hypothetical protein [Nitrospirota bacterium]
MKGLEFLQENNGSFSSNRLGFLLWIIGVLVVWIMESIKCGELQHIPDSVQVIIGTLMTGKVIQKHFEKEEPEQPVKNPGN